MKQRANSFALFLFVYVCIVDFACKESPVDFIGTPSS